MSRAGRGRRRGWFARSGGRCRGRAGVRNHKCKSGVLAQHPQPVADVLPNGFQRGSEPYFSHFHLHLLHAAQFEVGLAAGLLRGQAGFNFFFGEQVEIGGAKSLFGSHSVQGGYG